ncbi:MAG: T9SS type A sorting domain-containing protein [Saprospiraceae bacterium]|nr:T9SS type A sorting domain-containing protein [Saprospiraceae bacterium]
MKKNYPVFVGLIAVLLAWWSPVQANTSPVSFTLICPNDVTVDCDAELWDLSIYGSAVIHNYSGYHPAGSPVVHYALNSCGSGYITRTWTVEDPYWNQVSCTQTITVGGGGAFNGSSITWPAMVTLEGCNPNTHPDITGKPQWVPVECAMIGYSYSDQLYTVSPDCKKILRKWTVIDWCQMSNTGGYNTQGTWTFTQTIKIVQNVPPAFACIPDLTVSAYDCKFGKVIANPLVIDASSCGGNYNITNNSVYATEKKANISGVYPVGTTKVTLTVNYGCGQKKTCVVNVTVKNDKGPVPVCINSLSVALMGLDTDLDGVNDQGMVELWAKDLNWKSYSTCNNNPLRFSFSPDPTQMSKTFTCEHIGKNKVRMYVTDSKGNQSYCEVELDIQNNGANIKDCKPKPTVVASKKFTASGLVSDVYDKGLTGVEILLFDPLKLYEVKTTYDTTKVIVKDSFKNLSGYWLYFFDEKITVTSHTDIVAVNTFVYSRKTDEKGSFAFDTLMDKHGSYMLKCPELSARPLANIDKADLDLLTLHLLGQQPFKYSWQYLAADLDRNGRIDIDDLNLMIKFIKGEITSFAEKNHEVIVYSATIAAWKTEILSKKQNWLALDSIAADARQLHFLTVQLGDISLEKAVGNMATDGDIEANLRAVQGITINPVEVYPNPFSNDLYIRFDAAENLGADFDLYDWSGRLILAQKLELTKGINEVHLDGGTMTPGLYHYQFTTGDKRQGGSVVRQ